MFSFFLIPVNLSVAFFSGIGLEIGTGINQLLWSAPFNIRTPGGVAVDRTGASTVFNIRINYSSTLSESFILQPFVGYNQIGGSRGGDEGYSFDSIEFGGFLLWKVSNICVGIGGKHNSHKTVEYSYSTIEDIDRSDWFKDYSNDIGFRASYMFEPITLSIETWFGFSNLSSGPLTHASIHQNHMRILIGYTL